MKRYRDWKISAKVGSGTGTIILTFMLVLMGANMLIYLSYHGIDTMFRLFLTEKYMMEIRLNEKNYLLTEDSVHAERFEDSYRQLSSVINGLEGAMIFDEQRAKMEKVMIYVDAYADEFRAIVTSENGSAASLEKRACEMLDYTLGGVQSGTEFGLGILSTWTRRILIASVLITIFGIIQGVALVRMIRRVLDKCVDFATDLAAGSLVAELDIHQADEFGILADAMRSMRDGLNELVGKVRMTSISVADESRQVRETSEQVSTGVGRQATAVEEIAATIEEMSTTIKNSALHAEKGSEKAEIAVRTVKENSGISGRVGDAMGDIAESSARIGNIINTVNEVAFQTNLLALNAAVEAARAGEHGKGFAVVADEVRALSQRTSEAASEIKLLIEEAIDRVEAGSVLVTEAETSLSGIREHTEALAFSMQEIALSSREQAAGIDELNRAVSEVDSGTQLSASVVEELAGSAEEMASEAETLKKLVAGFRTRNDAATVELRSLGVLEAAPV